MMDLQQRFQQFDTSRTGKLDKKAVEQLLQSLGEPYQIGHIKAQHPAADCIRRDILLLCHLHCMCLNLCNEDLTVPYMLWQDTG